MCLNIYDYLRHTLCKLGVFKCVCVCVRVRARTFEYKCMSVSIVPYVYMHEWVCMYV